MLGHPEILLIGNHVACQTNYSPSKHEKIFILVELQKGLEAGAIDIDIRYFPLCINGNLHKKPPRLI